MPLVSTNNLKVLIPLGGAIIFAGTAGYLFYQLLQKDEDELDENAVKTSLFNIIPLSKEEIKIPKIAIGAVIGRQGRTIKSIQETTQTTVNFLDTEDKNGDRTCIIRGKVDKIEEAKQWILRTVKEIPVLETEKVTVPRNCVGRIIGRNGETINSISRVTGAKIKIPDLNSGCNVIDEDRQIFVRGSEQQIKAAKLLIQEQISEYKETRHKIMKSAASFSQRSASSIEKNDLNDQDHSLSESVSEDATISAYVTAMESAAHFWIQVCDSNTIVLADLVIKMTDYYSEELNRSIHEVEKLSPGTVVAALFPIDNKWYRGRICESVKGDEEEDGRIPVYFVDFGDTAMISTKDICELRTDFLTLKFQAVECFLAGIDAQSLTEDSSELFIKRTFLGQGKPVTINIVSYDKNQIPSVKITFLDQDSSEILDVGETLVQKEKAKWTMEARNGN